MMIRKQVNIVLACENLIHLLKNRVHRKRILFKCCPNILCLVKNSIKECESLMHLFLYWHTKIRSAALCDH